MFFSSKKVIGLDIGTNSIKMCELDVSRSGATLLSFGIAPTPSNTINGGEISNPQVMSAAIKNILAELGTRRRNVAIGMWGTAVIVKRISIPKMDAKLVREQLKWEAEQYIPFDVNEITLSHHILPFASSSDTMDVLLIAAQNDIVARYVGSVEGAGCNCSVLDVSGFALANLYEFNYGRQRDVVVLLNIGAGVSNFIVLNQGEVIFSRDIPVGGAAITNEIHKEMGVTLQEAEALKLSASARKEVPDEVHSIMAVAVDQLAEEIRNSFEFFAASANGLAVQRLVITGGGSLTPGLNEKISAALSLPFEIMNPFQKVRGTKQFSTQYMSQIAPFAAVVCGLALREGGDS